MSYCLHSLHLRHNQLCMRIFSEIGILRSFCAYVSVQAQGDVNENWILSQTLLLYLFLGLNGLKSLEWFKSARLHMQMIQFHSMMVKLCN